jgi:HNH endonuclease
MPIAEKDIKLLWGRAAGHCNNPACRQKLSETSEVGESFLTGEMAHIIARNVGGPRGSAQGGPDAYENLILLCPTCHTKVDKAPEGTYPAEHLHAWKAQHEAWVDGWSRASKMQSTGELMMFISRLLAENKHYFDDYGPHSSAAVSNPASSAFAIWVARRLDTILPNNRKILKVLEVNDDLIPSEMAGDVIAFKDHAQGYEMNQYGRLETYRLFPQSFAVGVAKWADND